jgi:CRP-like cAMP-binding protein
MARSDDKLEQLQAFELFRHVPKKDLPRLAGMLGDEVTVPAGHVLTEQGRMASEAWLVIDGNADVIVGKRAVASIGPGESIGEMAVVDNWPRSASVVARTPMRVYEIPADRFLAMLDEVPTVARALTQLLSARLRKLDIRPPGF